MKLDEESLSARSACVAKQERLAWCFRSLGIYLRFRREWKTCGRPRQVVKCYFPGGHYMFNPFLRQARSTRLCDATCPKRKDVHPVRGVPCDVRNTSIVRLARRKAHPGPTGAQPSVASALHTSMPKWAIFGHFWVFLLFWGKNWIFLRIKE